MVATQDNHPKPKLGSSSRRRIRSGRHGNDAVRDDWGDRDDNSGIVVHIKERVG